MELSSEADAVAELFEMKGRDSKESAQYVRSSRPFYSARLRRRPPKPPPPPRSPPRPITTATPKLTAPTCDALR